MALRTAFMVPYCMNVNSAVFEAGSASAVRLSELPRNGCIWSFTVRSIPSRNPSRWTLTVEVAHLKTCSGNSFSLSLRRRSLGSSAGYFGYSVFPVRSIPKSLNPSSLSMKSMDLLSTGMG